MSIEQDEHAWLRHRIVRMRTTLLRFAKDPRAETALRDLIAEAEARLEALEAKAAAADRRREMTRGLRPDHDRHMAKGRMAAAEVRKRANAGAVELRPIIAGL